MKQSITFFLLLCSYIVSGAQATSLIVDNQTPGWLSSKIGYTDQQTVENLEIKGFLNPDDLMFIGTLINSHRLNGHLNLEGCQIVDKNGSLTNALEENCFGISYDSENMEIAKISMPIKLVSSDKCIYSGLLVDTLVIGSNNMSIIGWRFFQGTTRGQSHHNIRNFIIREGVTQIGEKFCYKVDSSIDLQAISASFPKTLTGIGKYAFENCSHLSTVNLPNSIESIELDAFKGTSFLPDTLYLPSSLTQYNTTAFPIKDGQVVMIPETVTKINNTYQTYNNMTNSWTSSDYISSSNKYIWVMSSTIPPSISYRSESFLKGTTIYVPKGSYSDYSSKKPYSLAKLIEVIPIEGISFNYGILPMFVNETINVKPIITPPNATNKELIWTSSNPEIATVDANGSIQALKYGQTEVNATTLDRQISASLSVSIFEHITSISLPSSLNINIAEKKQLIPEILPIGKNNGSVSWKSSDQDIATVDENGNVKGISKGTCIITVTTLDGGFSANCTVSVIQPVESITVAPKSLSIIVGDNARIVANVLPTDANDKSVSWISSDESILTVNGEGMIFGINPGIAKITATSNFNREISDVCNVTVLQPVGGITLNKSEIEIIEDESIQLVASVIPENASNKNVNWTSSDVSVAMISPDGTVYAIKPGQATIMATTVDGGFAALCKVTVKSKTILVSRIDLSSYAETLAIGETSQLNTLFFPENASTKAVNWTSTNPLIASVNDRGLVTALSEGKTQIIATTTDGSDLSAICEITVEKQFINISQLNITPSNARIAVGQTLVLNTIITPNEASNKTLTWSSTNPAIATVSATGEVVAVTNGEAIIIASTQDGSNLSATCHITVYTETIYVESIHLNYSSIEGFVNDTFQIEASVLPITASNKTLSWTSSDENIATVRDGLVKLKSLGNTIITARATDGSDISSECTVTISERAGIDSVIADKSSPVKIYNLSGYLVYEGIFSEAKLPSGHYIIICNGSTLKVKIDSCSE